MIDVDTVTKYLSVLTGRQFQVGDSDGFPIQKENVKWFLWSRGGGATVKKMPYIHVAWIGHDETLHIETEPLGDTSDLTEWMYGEKALSELANMDLREFEQVAVREKYATKFPRVVKRLETYERFVAKASAKSGVQMELLYHGVERLASFRLGARFSIGGVAEPLVLHQIDRSIAALKQVYYEIAERQKTLYFTWALPANRETEAR